MSSTPIFLTDATPAVGAKITQLYPYLELFSEGEPPRNTLFILGKAPLSVINSEPDQMLIVDPPADVSARFSLSGNVAALFSGAPRDVQVSQMQTEPGGVAHLRLGEHFLDVYSQPRHNVIHLPTLGILYGGAFGSDDVPPQVMPPLDNGEAGGMELETLRLLAGLLKRRVRLYIPHVGAISEEPVATMTRLADDVAYLHALRRVIPAAVRRGDDLAQIERLGDALLPEQWRTPAGRTVHRDNLRNFLPE